MTATLPSSTIAPPTGALCELRHVAHDYSMPNGSPLHVLEDINISINPGEIILLLGHSGCGKSTIMRIMAGLITPTKGQVLYHNKPLVGVNPGTSIVFQSFALYPWMTVRRNVEVVLEAAGRPREIIQPKAEAVIARVGLAGFEDAYPRELSGGMKQRVGMARALSVEPEILFMDEPFSAVDALVAESLRAAVTDLWAAKHSNPSSILMVSHDIKEVAYMADRIIVLSSNPGRVRKVVENTLPRPRDYRSPAFLKLVDYLHDIITGTELPDVPELTAPHPAADVVEPLPDVTPGEVVGLLEYLDARGGREDVFKIATDTNREFGQVISVVKAAELLDLVDTPKRMVVLEADGQRFLKATPDGQRDIWREKILQLRLFREVRDLIDHQENHEVDRELVLETIIFRVPYEDYEKIFNTMVKWARFGDLFAYEETTEKLTALIDFLNNATCAGRHAPSRRVVCVLSHGLGICRWNQPRTARCSAFLAAGTRVSRIALAMISESPLRLISLHNSAK